MGQDPKQWAESLTVSNKHKLQVRLSEPEVLRDHIGMPTFQMRREVIYARALKPRRTQPHLFTTINNIILVALFSQDELMVDFGLGILISSSMMSILILEVLLVNKSLKNQK